ncbi:MAG: hypothetical protein V1668_01820 [Patescibacteria group bacterium]
MIFTLGCAGWAVAYYIIFPKSIKFYGSDHQTSGQWAVTRGTGQIMEYSSKTVYMWKKRCPDVIAVSFRDRVQSSTMKVSPITPNPKVRTIVYTVWVDVAIHSLKTMESFIAYVTDVMGKEPTALEKDWNLIDEIVRFKLYEFNNSHSAEIAEFYNPLDPKQQFRFKKLISTFLNDGLEKIGLTVANTAFKLA